MDVPFVLTRELQLNQRTVELLSSKKQVIVFGHIGHMPIPETDEQVTLKSKIIQMLYFDCNLIMPTRNPSNLLQSWMHYAEKRSNQVLLMLANGFDIKQCSGNDLSMLAKMHPLKQNAVRVDFDSTGNVSNFYFSDDFAPIELAAEDEEYNLLKFVDHLRYTLHDGIYQLTSMSTQLFAPYLQKLEKKMRKGKAVFVEPPVSDENRKITYYDCENIYSKHQVLLDQAIAPGFSETLVEIRENVSHKKSSKMGCQFNSVNKKLQEIRNSC